MTDIIGRRRKPAPWRLATIHGVPLFVGPGILLPMGLSAVPKLFEGVAVALSTSAMFLGAVIVHEAAHAVAARRRGLPVRAVSIGSGSFCRCGDVTAARIGVFVYAAGALTNLALSVIFAAVSLALVPDGRVKPFIDAAMQVNLLLGMSNLMPAFDLDGGWIACLLLERALPPRLADTIVGSVGLVIEAMSVVMIIVLLAFGWPLAWSIGGASMNLLRWTWRKQPPVAPDEPGSQTSRPVPVWLIRHPPETHGETSTR